MHICRLQTGFYFFSFYALSIGREVAEIGQNTYYKIGRFNVTFNIVITKLSI